MKRKIIHIDEQKCNGCGLCLPNCPEGAIQIIEGKARLVSDLFCDGLGACMGHCPEGAITIEEREAEPYDERKVMENIIRQGPAVIAAHLQHLQDHGEHQLLEQAKQILQEKNIEFEQKKAPAGHHSGGCPGARAMSFKKEQTPQQTGTRQSQLRQWPVQMHLISPQASYFKKQDLLIAADCVAYALGDFHKDYLQGKALAIACPKLDSEQQVYLQKIIALIDQAQVNTITVMTMEVPCCNGLLRLVQQAAQQAARKIPIKLINVGLQGDILAEDWIAV